MNRKTHSTKGLPSLETLKGLLRQTGDVRRFLEQQLGEIEVADGVLVTLENACAADAAARAAVAHVRGRLAATRTRSVLVTQWLELLEERARRRQPSRPGTPNAKTAPVRVARQVRRARRDTRRGVSRVGAS